MFFFITVLNYKVCEFYCPSQFGAEKYFDKNFDFVFINNDIKKKLISPKIFKIEKQNFQFLISATFGGDY